MTERMLVEPDLEFIKNVGILGGEDVKKCYQCATCAVVCPISPDNRPFPRKEMIAASWGLKDKLVKSADPWLCHNCGDCSTRCPRKAKPADVLGAVRAQAIMEYSRPRWLAKAVNDPKQLPILIAIPALLFLVVGTVTGLLNFKPDLSGGIAHYKFFSTWLVDMHMVPSAIFMVAVFALGLKRFFNDIHQNALAEGKTKREDLNPIGMVQAFLRVIPTILKHKKFDECGENKDRSLAHLLTFYSFVGLFFVTSVIFIVLYGSYLMPGGPTHGPWSQINPIKWLANLSGVALIIGTGLMIKNRLNKTDQKSAYKDWFLIAIAFGLGVTGMLTELTRLAGWAPVTFFLYFLHLINIFFFIAYLPFTKFAHLVYRTAAMTYAEYAQRK